MKNQKPKRRHPKHKRRAVIRDNIATATAPIYRYRLATPLTPRAVRNQLVAAANELPDDVRREWLAKRRMPLDRLLTEEQAACLEHYVECEEWLAGNARVADFAGNRVQASRSNMAPLPDDILPQLHAHVSIKRQLIDKERVLLDVFCRQMAAEQDAPTPAFVGAQLFPQARNKRNAYFEALRDVAERIVDLSVKA